MRKSLAAVAAAFLVFLAPTALTEVAAAPTSADAGNDMSNAGSRHITPPKPAGTHNIDEFYPPDARRQNEEGDVVVAFVVRVDGTVSDAVVEKSSNNALLDAAAVAAVSTWHYFPAMHDAKPVEFHSHVDIRFRLTSGPDVPVYSVIQAPADAYPSAALSQRQEGNTVLTIALDEKGAITDVRATRPSGVPALDDAAIDLARHRWHFSSASVDGKAVKTILIIVVRWSLTQPPLTPWVPEPHKP